MLILLFVLNVFASDALESTTKITLRKTELKLGAFKCEGGIIVPLIPRNDGSIALGYNTRIYSMTRVPSLTGSNNIIRLEDTVSGMLWIQTSQKAMLLNTKTNLRLADNCLR